MDFQNLQPPSNFHGLRREPAEESDDIYPGLSVHDDRQTGSIVIDHGRLPLWAFLATLAEAGWTRVLDDYPHIPDEYKYTAESLGSFLTDLLQQRGEMARLILTLADVERRTREREEAGEDAPPWWASRESRTRMRQQLARCMEALERDELEEQ